MFRIRTVLTAAAVAGLLSIVGAASTAGNTMPSASAVRGYGSQTITGVTAKTITYNTNTLGDTITSVGLVLTGDTTKNTIQIAFNDATPATCSGTGTYAALSNDTTYSCTTNQSVATATKFALVAS